ncbi:MAG: serine protease Do [Clostridia bacterium]|jgi:Do/DeqQ family serine protease|nr:HtrA2 peptidase [Clostridiales bacterium]MDK2985457.1 serine protease Do [Clostridia bacterium]
MNLNKRTLTILLVVVFLIGVGVGGYLFYSRPSIAQTGLDDGQDASEVISHPQTGGPIDVASIAKKVSPAVVKIETIRTVSASQMDPFFNDPFFREFFGGKQFEVPRKSSGLGSGFIISKEGYILTNQHVVDNAEKITVTMQDKEEPIEAKIIGQDEQLDLAVLKIPEDKDLPVLKLGDSEKVNVGDWVVAIGNPYGLDHTVTAGVISAKGRPLTIDGKVFKNLLQTDASINPGNSGGPLLNLKGEVIGINTAINARAQGIGFAIPTETVKEVLDQLIEKGEVIRPWLGVYIQDVTPELQEYFGLSEQKGAVIASVQPGSPAEKAGLRRGDVVLEFNRQEIKTSEDLVEKIKKCEVGQKVVLLVFRDGVTKYVTVKIGKS